MAHIKLPEPVALCAEKHRDFGVLRGIADLTLNSSYVSISFFELAEVARDYPILFLAAEVLTPICFLSGQAKVDASSTNMVGRVSAPYVPLKLRLYPFFLQKLPGEETGMLLFDGAQEQVMPMNSNDKAVALFDSGGEPSEYLVQIGRMSAQLYHGQLQAMSFAAALHSAGLLMPSILEIKSIGLDVSSSSGRILALNEPALRALPQDSVFDLFRKGYLDAAILVAQSQKHWEFARRI